MEQTRGKLSLVRSEQRLPVWPGAFGGGLEESLTAVGAATTLALSPLGCQRLRMGTKKVPRRGVTWTEGSVKINVENTGNFKLMCPRDLPPPT